MTGPTWTERIFEFVCDESLAEGHTPREAASAIADLVDLLDALRDSLLPRIGH